MAGCKSAVVALAAAVGERRRCNAAERAVVAELLVMAAHREVVLAVAERKQRSFVLEVEAVDLKVLLLSKDPLSRRTSCMLLNEVDGQTETHRLLYRVQQDLRRYSAVDGLFVAAFRIELAEENWFELAQA